ncbi:MAG: NADH-quinone oxidoreductase subunit C [Opitutales bacterium]
MSEEVLNCLLERFEFLTERVSSDHVALNCPAEQLVTVCTALRDEFDFDMLVDVTAVDWDTERPRFTGIYHLFSTGKQRYIRVAADCPSDGEPALPSLTPLYPAANWHERETYDLFGIRYEGHPYLTRILMWEGYPYHPLRKEFPLAGIEAPLPADDVAAATGADVEAAPMMGGPFVSSGGPRMSETEPQARDESWTETHEKPQDERGA